MIINLNKNIYGKDPIYKSIKIWNDYLCSPKLFENKTTINISINREKVNDNTINEFLNYLLDLTSSLELS